MGVERRGAARTQDPQILEPVIVAHTVHVVEDQSQPSGLPQLARAAHLADPQLETFRIETLLELDAGERRPLDEDLVERPCNEPSPEQRRATRCVRVEVVDRNAPHLEA
jgi:hypothetical protein